MADSPVVLVSSALLQVAAQNVPVGTKMEQFPIVTQKLRLAESLRLTRVVPSLA